MEFNKKLYELRKRKGLTQEELAEALYVSRTAISKWESGRGYPGIDSLKEIAKYFSVTIDELLSGDEILCIAEKDNKQKETHFRTIVFGLLDVSVVLFLFLPLFGQRTNGLIHGVSLLSLNRISTYLKFIYYVILISVTICGVITLAFQNCQKTLWIQAKDKISLILNLIAVFLFIVSSQPYAGALLFTFLVLKALILIKWK